MNTRSKLCLSLALLPLLLIGNAAVVSPRGAALFPSVVVVPPKWPRTGYLTWNTPEVAQVVVYEIQWMTNAVMPLTRRSGTNIITDPWKFKEKDWRSFTNVPGPPVKITANLPHALFRLRARDPNTGLASNWSSN